MLKGLRNILFIFLVLLLMPNRSFSQDLGEPDTCTVEQIGTVQPSSHFELKINVFNDEALGGYAIPLNFGAPPMDITCDSLSFTGTRTINPGLYGLEVDTANYSLILYAVWYSGNLAPGEGSIATLYFSTGPNWDTAQGYFIDTMIWPPTQSLEFSDDAGNSFVPIFKRGSYGPFISIISPNGGELWYAGETREISWVSNLSQAENVRIEYSTDQGGNWVSVVDSTPNDGSYLWIIPSVVSDSLLIRISEASDGKPWDVSHGNFSIRLFTMYAYPGLRVVDVGGASTDYIVKVISASTPSVSLSLLGLPLGANHSFSLNPVIPPDSSILTVNTTAGTGVGTYSLTLRAQSDGQITDSQLTLVVNQAPEPFNLSHPANGDSVKSLYAVLSWEKANDPDPSDLITYTIYYSIDSTFTLGDSLKTTFTSVWLHPMQDSIFYFWKFRAVDKWGKFTWCSQPFWSFFYFYTPLYPNRGDVNADGKLNVADVIYLINYLFKFGPPPVTMESGDANCDGKVFVADVVYLVYYLFKGGPPPSC